MQKLKHTLPPRIVIGDGVAKQVGKEAKILGATKVLLVSDKGVEAAGLVKPIREYLEGAGLGVEIFLDVQPNPLASQVRAAAKVYKDGSCDGVVALGGGSVMDVAKCVAIMARHPGDIMDYELSRGGLSKISSNQPPLLALSTTSGTGSEVSVGAVITDDDTHTKKMVVSPFVMPKIAIDDPLLTHGLPAWQTACTGMDALTHSIEAYVAKIQSPLGSALALEAIGLIGQNLVKAVKEPNDNAARFNMMYAAMIAGIAFSQNNLGAVHACAHQLSTEFGFAHGFANALMLPPVMRYNLDYNLGKFARIAIALGANPDKSESKLVEESIRLVEKLRDEVGIPGSIRDGKGARPADLKKLAAQAMGDLSHLTNPKPCNPELMAQFFSEAGAEAL